AHVDQRDIVALAQEDVGRLEVLVDEVALTRADIDLAVEPDEDGEDLFGDGEDAALGVLLEAALRDGSGQRLAVDALHHEVGFLLQELAGEIVAPEPPIVAWL